MVVDAGVSTGLEGGLPGRGSTGLGVKGGEAAGLASTRMGEGQGAVASVLLPAVGRLCPRPFLT